MPSNYRDLVSRDGDLPGHQALVVQALINGRNFVSSYPGTSQYSESVIPMSERGSIIDAAIRPRGAIRMRARKFECCAHSAHSRARGL